MIIAMLLDVYISERGGNIFFQCKATFNQLWRRKSIGLWGWIQGRVEGLEKTET